MTIAFCSHTFGMPSTLVCNCCFCNIIDFAELNSLGQNHFIFNWMCRSRKSDSIHFESLSRRNNWLPSSFNSLWILKPHHLVIILFSASRPHRCHSIPSGSSPRPLKKYRQTTIHQNYSTTAGITDSKLFANKRKFFFCRIRWKIKRERTRGT